MKPIAPNTLIQNRYLIVHLIGKGGMGEVYLAVDQRLGSAIALKRTFFSDDATLGNAFEREAKTLARLRHPALPKVSDHFTEEGTQYLVMEHISGEDMSKRLEAMQKPFPVSWVLFWADQLLDALTYLHTHEPPIIHRDIKPQNLKLTDENHIVLLDFGLSKNSVGETRATTTGSIVGYTPHYASMEQIRGTGTNARSDLYSLSATLYQIMTGTVPPDALTRADSLINGMPDPITPINDLNKEVSKPVSDVIIKGMAISQEQRYATAREMQKALRDAYSQLQGDMSAQTVAFNSQVQTAQPGGSISNPQPTAAPPPIQSQTAPPIESIPAQQQTVDASAHLSQPPAAKAEPDFDATIPIDNAIHDTSPKQSDIKTEVFLAGSSSAIADVQNNYPREESYAAPATDFGKEEDFGASESFAAEDDFSAPANFSPDSTVPLFSFDNQSGDAAASATNFDSQSGGDANKTAVNIAADDYAPKEDAPKPAVAAAPAKQKSSKALAVGGGLAALLILAIGAVGLGWYFLGNRGGSTVKTTPTPTVEATASIEPSVEPTTELGSDTNSATNTEIGTSETNSTIDNTQIGTSDTPRTTLPGGQQPTPTKTTSVRPTPQIGAVRTPTPPPGGAKTPPPAKTPAKGGKLDILQ